MITSKFDNTELSSIIRQLSDYTNTQFFLASWKWGDWNHPMPLIKMSTIRSLDPCFCFSLLQKMCTNDNALIKPISFLTYGDIGKF